MKFLYTFRDRTGRIVEGNIEVSSRADFFAKMKELGIQPLKVNETRITIPECSSDGSGKSHRSRHLLTRIVVSSLGALVILGCICLLARQNQGKLGDEEKISHTKFFPSNSLPSIKSGKGTQQVDISAKAIVPSAKKKKIETYRDERGIERYMNGARVPQPGKEKQPATRVVTNQPIFRNWAENQIATLLTLESGRQLFGTRRFDARFLESFKQSLKTPIEILETDNEEVKNLKQNMIIVKKELADSLAKGEDICNMLQETYSELNRLSSYKRGLQQELREIAKNGDVSSEDFKALVAKANEMLAAKGISPVKMSSIIKINLKLTDQQKKEPAR